jgi:hypothetical protein
MQSQTSPYHAITVIRWLARIWSIASIGFVLAFVLGEGLNPVQLTLREGVLLLFFPVGLGLGLILAWLWADLGGSLAVGCFIAFYLLHFVWYGNFPHGPYFALVAAPGFLFLLGHFLSREG